jgi:hypothetical protein
MSFGKTIDHVLMDPKGGVSRNKAARLSTADEKDRRRARTRSHVATTRLRAKLHAIEIVQQHDSSWCHVLDGMVIARFATVGDAVAAL